MKATAYIPVYALEVEPGVYIVDTDGKVITAHTEAELTLRYAMGRNLNPHAPLMVTPRKIDTLRVELEFEEEFDICKR